jgi:MYXO-CTERM domain-containing protein
MGSVRIPLYAAAGAVALFSLCAVPAHAASPAPAGPAGQSRGDMTLTPAVASPGADLDIRTQSCGHAVTGTVSSTAFVSSARLAPAADGGLFAQAVVSSGASAGSYPVYIDCDGLPHAAEGRLTISGGGHGSRGSGNDWGTTGGDQGGSKQWGGGGASQGGRQWGAAGGTDQGSKQWGGGGGTDQTGKQWGGGGGTDQTGRQWGGGGADQTGKQWGGGGAAGGAGGAAGAGGGDKTVWGEVPSTPIAPVPAGGGGTAKLTVHDTASGTAARQPHEAEVPGYVAAGVLGVAGVAGLALHRRRRGHGRDRD